MCPPGYGVRRHGHGVVSVRSCPVGDATARARRERAVLGLSESAAGECSGDIDINTISLQVARRSGFKVTDMDTRAQLRQYIAENLLFSETGYGYDDQASFLEQGILDSMGVMELVHFVEEAFGVKVADDDLTPDNFDSVERLAQYVERHQLSLTA
jgi:acyl carrier protein